MFFSFYTYKKAVSTVPLEFTIILARYITIFYLHLPLRVRVAIFTIACLASSTPICALLKISAVYLLSFVTFSLSISQSLSLSFPTATSMKFV